MPASAKLFLSIGAALAASAVIMGAFGAHVLRPRLSAQMFEVYRTAVEYHFWHALGLLAIGLACLQLPNSGWLRTAGWLLTAGVVLFSGSLYALALSGVRLLGAITPFGGVMFILGWIALLIAVLRA